MTRNTTYIFILTLNVNGLNSLIKKHGMAGWIKKQDLTIFLLPARSTSHCTFFSATHRTFSKIDHILRCKAILRKYMKIEITPCISSGHN
jgi:hypothetical protein